MLKHAVCYYSETMGIFYGFTSEYAEMFFHIRTYTITNPCQMDENFCFIIGMISVSFSLLNRLSLISVRVKIYHNALMIVPTVSV